MQDLKTMVSGKVKFKFYRKGSLYYTTEDGFLFPVPVEDCGDATFNEEDKGILFMRYIRKAMADQQSAKEESEQDVG